MEIRTFDRESLTEEYGAFCQRLLPWPVLNAPFEGAWCVLEPGMATTPHSHHEYELFIATAGRAVLESDGVRRPFAAGDLAYLPPGSTHQVINDGDTAFQMYSVWWDQQMSEKFAANSE